MNKAFENIILKHINDPILVNRIIVTAYAAHNDITNVSNQLIGELLLTKDHPIYSELIGLTRKIEFDDVIEAFEVAIPTKESQTNGAVYTPSRIKDYIVNKALQEIDTPIGDLLAGDISCGCGAFLYTLAKTLKSEFETTYSEIFQNQLFGLDISLNSIERTKILLTLLAISEGEDINKFNFNLYVANALDFDWNTITPISNNKGFDIIVGNPPYVRAKNLDKASKDLLKNWQVTKTGNPDLYIPFFEIGISNLNETGVLGYITVNSFFKSVNARSLRKYFASESIALSIINFGHEQVFKNKLTYTCLCFASKVKMNELKYLKTSSNKLEEIIARHFYSLDYKSLDHHRGWMLNNPKSLSNIKRIENTGTPLGELLPIKNGIATLSNNTYIFKPIDETNDFYIFKKDGKVHQVEKRICRDIIKPNILKKESEISVLQEKIIYPYSNGTNPLSLIKEEFFLSEYPMAYKYLKSHKEGLSKRDKGKGDYEAWFAFGRTQALKDKGLKLLFPYISKHPHFVYTDNIEMLIYCGYAVFSNSADELLVLKKILESSVFDYYMQNTSKPYASGYYSYAKNYVKYFGVYDLSNDEKEVLLNLKSKKEINEFVEEKYKVSI
jgi:hypothetical protein